VKNQWLHTTILTLALTGSLTTLVFTVHNILEQQPSTAPSTFLLQEIPQKDQDVKLLFVPAITLAKCPDQGQTKPACLSSKTECISTSRIALSKKNTCKATEDRIQLHQSKANTSLNLVLENYNIQKLTTPHNQGITYAFTIETFELEIIRSEKKALQAAREQSITASREALMSKERRSLWNRIYPRKKAV